MSYTKIELDRIVKIENTIKRLFYLISGVGSKNQLNQLLVLCDAQVKQLESKMNALEIDIDKLILLAQKLQ